MTRSVLVIGDDGHQVLQPLGDGDIPTELARKTWTTTQIGASLGHAHVWNEHPVGTVDGNNGTFVLLGVPLPAGSLLLFRNGLLMQAGGNDYTLQGSAVTFVAGNLPQPGDVLLASYVT